MQSDLLGAYALGLRNLLLITGDPPQIGDYADATAVYDVDSIGLTNMVHSLNNGLDVGGKSIGSPTGFLVGVGCNPGAVDNEDELKRFYYKVEAGAEFALTQPIFDVAMLERFIDRTKDSRIPVIAGIMPLASAAAAEFFTNEIPGCPVPRGILDRLKSAESAAAARAEGIRIAQELVRDIRGMVQGVQVRGPFEEYDTAIQVLNSPPVYSHA
jgi:homocysteine S-methyltransferase